MIFNRPRRDAFFDPSLELYLMFQLVAIGGLLLIIIIIGEIIVNGFTEMFSKAMIAERVQELATQISDDYAGREVIFICILKGAVIFMTDLMRHLQLDDATVEFMQVCSYEGVNSSGKVKMSLDVNVDISGKDIIVVEDIIDTGCTIDFIRKHLMTKNPASIKFCVLLDNPTRRGKNCPNPDYTGFVIPNQFVFGYGLDYDEKYRGLPYIAALTR